MDEFVCRALVWWGFLVWVFLFFNLRLAQQESLNF